MKKPEEIKKGLECCSTGRADDCFDCPYGDAEIGRIDDHCIEQLLRDNIARNQHLEKRIIHLEALNQQNLSVITMQERTRARLEERISWLEAERDQAVKDCSHFVCDTCAEQDNGDNCNWCTVVHGRRTGYVWRGLPEAPKEERE